MSTSDESRLVARAKAGDFAAFEQLVEPHEQRLFALARHLVGADEAADVLQTGLLAALESLASFRGDAAFATWLTRIVTNAGLKLLRKRRGGPRTVDIAVAEAETTPLPEFVADWRDDPVRSVERAELRHLLDEAIAALPEHHRSVFVLRDVAELSVAETAKALEISESNVKVRLLRARLALREKLTREFGDERRRVTIPLRHDHGHHREEGGAS